LAGIPGDLFRRFGPAAACLSVSNLAQGVLVDGRMTI
jgi:hypothetical protein